MSADDNLRDALIEALNGNIHEQAHRDGDYVRQVDDGLQFDGTMYVAELADIALKVIKDWTAEEPNPVDPLGISQLALITKCRIEADGMVARNTMDAACSRVPSYDEHHFSALATKLDNLI